MMTTHVLVGALPRGASRRSPLLAIGASLVAGVGLALVFVLTVAASGSEPIVTGWVLVAFGIGWGLMGALTGRFSAQPQAWTRVPAAVLGSVGLGLLAVQPGPAAMNAVGWVWPALIAALAIWMGIQARGHLRGRGRWLVGPVIAALLVLAIGGGLTTVSGAMVGTSGTASSPGSAFGGRLVDIGGRRLYLECTGSGSPTVILQAGLGASSASWTAIAPTVAASTTVCAYDRAGHGRSDEAAGPQDGVALAADLQTLLTRAGVPGPYIVVGHSSGGAYVRAYAARHADQVAGMVLLDSQPDDAFTALPEYAGFYAHLRTAATLAPSLARVGLLGPLLGLPAEEATIAAARGGRDEILALPSVLEQAAALTSLGDRPLIVVTAGAGAQPGWPAAQERLARLSTASSHRVLGAATHTSLVSGTDAAASAQAILDVLAAIRTGTAPR